MRTRFIRVVSTFALVSASLAAHAVSLGLTSTGTVSGDITLNPVSESVLLQIGGAGPLTTLNYELLFAPNNALGGDYYGTGTYSGPGGTLNFDVLLAKPSTSTFTLTYSGIWTLTSGTGTYAGATGDGTIGLSIFGASQSFTSFVGDIQVVPEPASMAALGLGAAAMLRRRRRA